MIDAKHILELSKQNPKDAHALVARAIGERGHRAFFEFKGRQSCIEKAQAKPLPGASANVFIKGATTVGDVVVREVVPIHIACLQAVDSPLLKLVQNAANQTGEKANENFSEEAQWEICYIFTQNPKELRKILKDGGADAIKKLAEETIDCNWTAAKINSVILAVIEQFHRHIQTTVKFAAEVEGQGDKSFFQALAGKV
jgi:hypothetical protein